LKTNRVFGPWRFYRFRFCLNSIGRPAKVVSEDDDRFRIAAARVRSRAASSSPGT
jgi:hypothetical protein